VLVAVVTAVARAVTPTVVPTVVPTVLMHQNTAIANAAMALASSPRGAEIPFLIPSPFIPHLANADDGGKDSLTPDRSLVLRHYC
jgi:hypothetical protein